MEGHQHYQRRKMYPYKIRQKLVFGTKAKPTVHEVGRLGNTVLCNVEAGPTFLARAAK